MPLPSFRHQLPAYSPLSLRDVVAGAKAAVLGTVERSADVVEALRTDLLRVYSASAASLLGSGTEALKVALDAARRARREEDFRVALPAYGCFDLVTAAVGASAPVLFYDLDPHTLSPDLDSLNRVLAEGAGAIVVAPLYGIPIPWAPVRAAAESWDAVVIEDAAQAHGAYWRGMPLGSLGRLSVLSFGRGKGWTGCGGGALLVRDSPQLEGILNREPVPADASRRGVGSLMMAAAQWAIGRPTIYGMVASQPWLHLGETRYRAPKPPSPISRAAAAIARSSRHAAGREARIRRRNARWLLQRIPFSSLEEGQVEPICTPEEADPSYLRLPLRVAGGSAGLGPPGRWRSLGVTPGYPVILPELPAARPLTVGSEGGYPGARSLAARLITFPTHSLLGDRDRESLARCMAG